MTRSYTRSRFTHRDSGAEAGAYTITGHAAVFDQPCDFGYFTEYIAPGAFKKALAKDPLEVVSNIQHDDRWVLGVTMNDTLKLSEDGIGLAQWTRVAPTSYAADLRILLDRGDIQQASFCFTIAAEEWEYIDNGDDSEEVKVTITEVDTLYDVTVCALGAYPQTDVSIASRERLAEAVASGRVRGLDLHRAQRRGLLPAAKVTRQTRAQQRAAQADARAAVQRAHRELVAMGIHPGTSTVRVPTHGPRDPRLRVPRAGRILARH
jgi:hypothetical protein